MLSVVPRPVTVRVPAKINLHLGVGDLRDDGYHELETVFQAVSLTDEISIVSADARSITVRGDNAAVVPTDHRNLAWAAVDAMAAVTGHSGEVAIEITKGIPVAGGMAGGSADAAAVLVGLARLWRVEPTRDEMYAMAADLGSDVSFSLHGGTALGSGRGENLMSVLSRGEFHWVIAIAGGGLSTPDVYRELDSLRRNESLSRASHPDELMQALAAGDPRRLAPLLRNDLQPAAVSLMPPLRRTLRAGTDAGAIAGIVSGSGPTCVFLCTDSDHAVDVAAELSGAGVCRSVRIASGPVPGARLVDDDQ
ncbi:4-(cytidine 5'-diphospho)-2-C-methyl-D-erythritol kinase [Williamsia phyllosphaerae]|uniref:4-diphosphocytidyl-2-C-methyl-D-erythritol kinase n=1 Tax=Williamsia phyllosphaerae TaxID=885042 RepID=A0ABQ1V2Z4_9NOCA|nr:4-(cytidine 5'-diphospho)-2-C-methyl-D-erythritol kinase [Williamsia phyllosphaerae]GGF33293.1 4-diphosphocytidyl-2-C-methyl-D-erythritol kinase [Williamsia phyllosphaerae]